MIGVAFILPFVAVLTNPSLIETNYILNFMFQTSNIFGVETDQQFLLTLGFLQSFVSMIVSSPFGDTMRISKGPTVVFNSLQTGIIGL